MTPLTAQRGRSRLVAYDVGAHLATWDVDGEPVIWCSERAVLDGSRPIRGGVPLCFPWFAAGPQGDLSPSHGPVRTTRWSTDPAQGEEVWAWTLTDADVADAPGAEHVPGPFRLRYAVTLLEEDPHPGLRLSLAITNPGTAVLAVEAALHTYLGIGDVERVTVTGLDGADYLDKVTGRRDRQEGLMRIEGETDSVLDSPGDPCVEVHDGRRRLVLTTQGSTQTVVWNPGEEKAATIGDLGAQEWRRFLCVETAATGDRRLEIAPGATHTVECRITVEVQA